MLIFNITFPKGLMTCVPDSLIRKLNTSEFQVIGLNRKPDAQDFIQALQEYNTKTENVTCQGVELKEQELKENMESIENIDLNRLNKGYLCSSCDPLLLLYCELFNVSIDFNFNGTNVNYHNTKESKRTIRFSSSSSHFQ